MSVCVFIVTCLLSLSVSPSLGFPLPGEPSDSDHTEDKDSDHIEDKFFEEGDLFEGDIILRPDQMARLQMKYLPGDSVKTLIADPTAIWPNKTVAYEFAPKEFSTAQQARISYALNDIMSVSCVRFVPRTNQPAYLVLRNNGLGCAAAVGYHNYGPLDLFLGGPSCQTRGTIQHEFLHALGFWHEHTRQDRDQHITILWQNISPGKEFNFYKRDPSEIMTLNTPYDYNSVMHYRSVAFSKDRRSETIIPKMPVAATRMGQRIRFSQVDLAKLNRLYQCPPTYYHGDFEIKRKNNGGNNEEAVSSPFEVTQDVVNQESFKKESEGDQSPGGVKIDVDVAKKSNDSASHNVDRYL